MSITQNRQLWEVITTIVRAVFPMMIVLRLADQKRPVMDKLYYYVRRMDKTIIKSKVMLDDLHDVLLDPNNGLFQDGLSQDLEAQSDDDDESFSEETESTSDTESEVDEPIGVKNTVGTFGDRVLANWNRRRENLISDYSIAGWLLCAIPDVREDAKSNQTGEHRNAMECLLKKLYMHEMEPSSEEVAEMLDTFWTEYEYFETKTGPYGNRLHIWNPNNRDIQEGKSHSWHKKIHCITRKYLEYLLAVCAQRLWGWGQRNAIGGMSSILRPTREVIWGVVR